MFLSWCVWYIVQQRPKQSSKQNQDLSQTCYLDVEFPVIEKDTVKAIEVSAEECIQWGLNDPSYGNSEEAKIDMYTYALNRRKIQMEDLERQIGRVFMEIPVVKSTLDSLRSDVDQYQQRKTELMLLRQNARNQKANMTRGNIMKIKASEDTYYNRQV